MTSNHHAPYDLGYTRTTMAVNKVNRTREGEETTKNSLSSDCRLQLAYMKPELLVIADQHAAVNTFCGWTAQIIQHEVDHCNGVLI